MGDIAQLCRCDTMDKLRKKCESLDREIRDQPKFKDFYQFTFSFAKNPGQKGLGTSTAVINHTVMLVPPQIWIWRLLIGTSC